MLIQLLKTACGAAALCVNRQLILEGDAEDDSAKLAEQTAERLAEAVGAPLQVLPLAPATADWNWPALIAAHVPPVTAADPVCQQCGTRLKGGLCRDETCPYSDWPQMIPIDDLSALSRDAVVAKYGLIRAEVHSDDRVLESSFFANDWFLQASDAEILALANEGWGQCEEADSVAQAAESMGVTRVFDYIHAHNAGNLEPIGFECTINVADALAWLRRTRYGVWAKLLCADNGVRLEADPNPDMPGRFVWLDTQGHPSAASFDSADHAAADAVLRLQLDARPAVTPLYDAFWSGTSFSSPNGSDMRHLVGLGMFNSESGYSASDIEEIAHLEIGHQWQSPDYGAAHCVRRIG